MKILHFQRLILGLGILVLFAGCNPQVLQTEYWPIHGWSTSTPGEQALDPVQLEKMLSAIDEQGLEIHSVLIIRNGYIVMEKYYPPYQEDTRHPLYSITKSFISSLVGIAISEGIIESIDKPVLEFFPKYEFTNVDQAKATMTLENLLTMTSGLSWDDMNGSDHEMGLAKDPIQYVLDQPMESEPGLEFSYNSGCSHLMSAIIQETTGMNTLDYAKSRLFEPIGITNLEWETDRTGTPFGGWGLELTPRDLAKFGYLYLKEGMWNEKQIIPAEWVRTSTESHVKFDDGWGYGYQWLPAPVHNGYAAIGRFSQLLVVIPDLEIVVIFTADHENHDDLFELIKTYIIPAS